MARSAGDVIPTGSEIIEVGVTELKQLFTSDGSTFDEPDLDTRMGDRIVSQARNADPKASLALLIHVDHAVGPAADTSALRATVHDFFATCALRSRQHLRRVLRRGRKSLAIGLAVLGVFTAIGTLIATRVGGRVGDLASESLVIGGWVAMWRPLEFLLYDWWPIVAEARLFDRLAAMPVSISYRTGGSAM